MMDLRGRSIRISKFSEQNGILVTLGQKMEVRTDGFDLNSSKEEL
jgi:hypothetical protein